MVDVQLKALSHVNGTSRMYQFPAYGAGLPVAAGNKLIASVTADWTGGTASTLGLG